MAHAYFIAVAISVLLALTILSRWSEPNTNVSLLNEILRIEKAMLNYARLRCLSDDQVADGSGLTKQRLKQSDYVNSVTLINQGYLSLSDLGFSETLTLPLAQTPENAFSAATGIAWNFVGWEQNRAVVNAVSSDPAKIRLLLAWFPVARKLNSSSLELLISPASQTQTTSKYAYLTEELFYASDYHPVGSLPHYPEAKKSCFL